MNFGAFFRLSFNRLLASATRLFATGFGVLLPSNLAVKLGLGGMGADFQERAVTGGPTAGGGDGGPTAAGGAGGPTSAGGAGGPTSAGDDGF